MAHPGFPDLTLSADTADCSPLIMDHLKLIWSRGDDSSTNFFHCGTWQTFFPGPKGIIGLGSQDSEETIESKVSWQGLNAGILESFNKVSMTSPRPEIWFHQ